MLHSGRAGGRPYNAGSAPPADGRHRPNCWASKADVEELVAAAQFPVHTFLRPGFFMENFLAPKADALFPELRHGRLVSAILPTTHLQLIAVDDIASAAIAAIEQPARFAGVALQLVGDVQTPVAIAAALSRATGVNVPAITLPAEELISRGMWPRWVKTQERYNVVNGATRPDRMERFGLSPTRFVDWAMLHAADLELAPCTR